MLIHDLRMPLSGLIMGLDMLGLPEDVFGPDEREDMLGRTRNAAGQLLGQVNTILFKAHIFEKYGQAPGAARRRGTGLRLTYCKLAVEAHGDQIGVRDGAHGGSVFWFRLPVAPL